MKIAIITPIPDLNKYATLSDYHLTLAHLALESDEYVSFYKDRVSKGDFVILDNSAHELGEGLDVDTCIKVAKAMNACEMVLPDKIGDGEITLKMAKESLDKVRAQLPGTQVMAVPQGKTIYEYKKCLEGLLNIGVDTIGIAKSSELLDGGINTSIEAILDTKTNVNMHLLGWGKNMNALYKVGLLYSDRIRGTDSAKALTYARAGLYINLDPYGVQPGLTQRQADFFGVSIEHDAQALHNVNVFRSWANGIFI